MDIQVSLSADGITKSDIPKFEWFKYNGKKIVLDSHNKEYDTEIRKGDVIGFRTIRNKTYLVDMDDIKIKFAVSAKEKLDFLKNAKPYFGKVKGVKVADATQIKKFDKTHTGLLNVETATTLRELAKKRNVFEKGMTKPDLIRAIIKADNSKPGKEKKPSKPTNIQPGKQKTPKKSNSKLNYDPLDLYVGQPVQVNTPEGWVPAEVVEEFDGSSIRVTPSKGQFAGAAIRVTPEELKPKKEPKPKELTAKQKDQAQYDAMHLATGAGALIRVRGIDYVVVYGRRQKLTSRTRFNNVLTVVPVDEKNPLVTVKVRDLNHLFKNLMYDKVTMEKYDHYAEVYAKRKAELNQNSAAAHEQNIDKLRKFKVEKGDIVGYQFDNKVTPVRVSVVDVDWEKGRIAIKGSGKKLRWLPGVKVEYKQHKEGAKEV